jgi:hypothetical protein
MGSGGVGEALPFLELCLKVNVALGAGSLAALLLVRPVGALDLALRLGEPGRMAEVGDALVLDPFGEIARDAA